MEKKTKTKFLRLALNSVNRYLFISDIHGDLALLKKTLEGIKFNKTDYLFIIGDLVEKGKENLPVLDYLMDLEKENHIYFLRGNCDEVFNFLIPPVDKEKLLFFALEKGNSVINEMASKLNIEINREVDSNALAQSFLANFSKYYDFVDSFYDAILLDEKYLLVHGGMDSLIIPEYNDSLLKNDFYYLKAKKMDYIRIVGHNPTVNLRKEVPSNKPIIDLFKNVIAIDGGNNVSLSGELNVLIIKNNQISYKTFNNYPKVLAKRAFTKPVLKVIHTNSYLDTLEYKNEIIGDYYILYKDNIPLLSHKKDVVFKNGQLFSYDATNSFLSVNENDEFYLACLGNPYSIAIKDEVVGFIESDVIR